MLTEEISDTSVEIICCGHCGNGLDLEEFKYPNTHPDEDGHICDNCYKEIYCDNCPRCEESVLKDELKSKPGQLIAIWEECPATPEDLQPGYYRVKAWPFYADYMFSGHFYANKLELVAQLDKRGEDVAKNAWCSSGALCEECQKQIEQKLVGQQIK
jgi:hypothetical protein